MNQNRPTGSPPSGVSISPVSPAASADTVMPPPAPPVGRPGGLRFEAFWGTDPGRSRDHNEDAISGTPPDYAQAATRGHLFVVADGMGGHNAGEIASNEAIKRVYSRYYADADPDLYRSLERAMRTANNELFQQAQADPAQHGMGTTMTAALIQGNHLTVAHVGDSRLYLIRGGKIELVTHDHSWVEEQVRAGVLTRLQAESHPQRNVITRALATGPDVRVDREERDLQPGDVLVYSSDGLNTEVGDAQIAAHATKAASAAEAVQRLIQLANDNGGEDNISVGVIRVLEATGTPAAPVAHVPRNKRRMAVIIGGAAVVLALIGGLAWAGSLRLGRGGGPAVTVTVAAPIAGVVASTPALGGTPAMPASASMTATAPAPGVSTQVMGTHTTTPTPATVTSTPAATKTPTSQPPIAAARTTTPQGTANGRTTQPTQPVSRFPAPIPQTPASGAHENGEVINFSWAGGGHALGATEAYALLLWPDNGEWGDKSGLDLPTPFGACEKKVQDTKSVVEGNTLSGSPWNSYGTYFWTVVIVDWAKKDAATGRCEVVSEQRSGNRFTYSPPSPSTSCGGSKSEKCEGAWQCVDGQWTCVH